MVIQNPCGICTKPVGKNHKAIQCDVCNFWIHIRCNDISPTQYNELIDNDESWICIKCLNSILPFGEIDHKSYYLTQRGITTQSNLENIQFSINATDKKLIK